MRIVALMLGMVVAAAGARAAESIHEFTMKSISGQAVALRSYQGKVVMVVNVASRCGFTPQYAGLEALYQRYKDRGLVILGFPANNFLWQEPGTNEEIRSFCSAKYGVTFPMFAKISVRGSDQAPLYRFLTEGKAATSGSVKWNFTKFLVGRDGRVVARFGPSTEPLAAEVVRAVEAALK